MEVRSVGQARYFLLFVDDASRMAFVYFLKEKNQVLQHFKEFHSMVRNQKGTKIKTLRTDNGGEFCSDMMEKYLKESGIIHQKTNPYTPEQNGLCERFNRTIVERARCLLFDAKMEKELWAEAVNTAVYLKNRSPASGLGQITPIEMWTGCKPDLGHIRVFGSPAMMHVPKAKRLKWDKKAVKYILVGYSENIKGYRLYNPETKKICTSRDVIIMERSDSTTQVEISNTNKNPLSEQENSTELFDETIQGQEDPTYVLDSDIQSSEDDSYRTLSEEEFDHMDSAETSQLPEKRPRRKPDRFGYTNLCVSDNLSELCADEITYKDATEGPDRKLATAMQEELQAFEQNKAWDIVDRKKQIEWCSVDGYSKKFESDSSIRYRARLVAKGFTQQQGVDFKETYAPVLRYSTLRLLFALSAKFNFEITHLDVVTAFLNGILNENVYMQAPLSLKCPRFGYQCPSRSPHIPSEKSDIISERVVDPESCLGRMRSTANSSARTCVDTGRIRYIP
ncbi:Retrovirus-related Pol polyprotein from transposon TNT 1-94 [Eumeta japonica]|uniref:Retrovirus-related Pol polyprotein from transposon TNT 1-94 n=1 Tax=Eumeta variegata TaxID=151549 RepID=A0A4C1X8V0_EUMVA|nr:Retrovirus-related Pol polyprotein from transposon TNT 1-94 [Eumeta japonica]